MDFLNKSNENIILSPVTLGQKEIWLKQQLSPDLPFNIAEYAEVTGDLNLSIFEQAVNDVIERTTGLNSRFTVIEGELYQFTDKENDEKLHIIEINDAKERFDLETWVQQDITTMVSVEDTKLYNFSLLCLPKNKFIFYSRYHHVLMDGRSMVSISKRICERYDSLVSGNEPEEILLYPLDLQAKKDIEYQQSKKLLSDEKFWSNYSQEGKDSNRLAFLCNTDNEREILKEEKEINNEVRRKINKISDKNNIQVAHIYISAIAIHFYTLTGIEKLSFSLPVTGTTGEAREVAGMTSNILPLEINISPSDNVIGIANAVSNKLAKILRHQRYRGENIQRKSKSDFGFGPSINLMLFERGPHFQHCETKWIKANGSQTHGFAVVLDDQGYGKGLSIGFYGSARRHTTEEMLDHHDRFGTILEQLATNPQQSMAELDQKLSALRDSTSRLSLFENIRSPLSAAVVNWVLQDAQQIANMALSLAPVVGTPPPITQMKILVNQKLYLANRISLLPEYSDLAPGALVKVDEQNDSWQISTLTGDVIVGGFSTLEGTPLSAAVLANQAKLSTGDRLPILTEQQSAALSETLSQLTVNEPYWLAKLERFNPADFPYVVNKTQEQSHLLTSQWQAGSVRNYDDNGLNVATIFIAYLYSLSGEQSFQLGYHVTTDRSDLCSQLASSWVPLDITDIQGQLTLNHINESLNAEIKLINQSYSFALDALSRYENLRKNAKLNQDRPTYALALAITQGDIPIQSVPESSLEDFPLLVLHVNSNNGDFRWIYNAAYLSETRIKQINDHVLCGLEKYLEDKTNNISMNEISFVTKGEEKFLLETLNSTEYACHDHLCIHSAFEQQVEKTPEAIAIRHGDETFTYREFDKIANRIAHQLIGFGIKADMRVALCMERSCLQIATLLGILKSGGCYVPLDPAYPIERLKDVLLDAKPSVLLVDAIGKVTLEGSTKAATYDVTSLFELELPDSTPQLSNHSINQLAYVIFTSGSTGRPKGVMVEHAQVMNLYYSLKADVFQHYRPQSRVCLNSSLSFDASLQSLLSLLSGHQLHIVPNDVRVDGERLVQFIHENAIDVFDCTPTQLEMLLLSELPNRVEQLILLIGGEALSTQTWRRLCDIKHFTAFNVYGPTECTVDATLAEISDLHLQPTIGRPIANTAIYLLDNRLKPVPFGAVGHMYISGAGVARGYLNQPALTDERFTPDPFLGKSARMYHTGDLARYLDDGNLEYLGRDDQQVKINGYRIEPGEIEEKLTSYHQVNEAVVIAYKTPTGEKQLVSYLVMAQGAETEDLPRRLREYLSKILPEFMLPTAYVPLTSLPTTPNGKIDHKHLPAPDFNAYVHECYQPPQGDTEQALHDIWTNILCVTKIGRNDSFFAIGGDSLMAMKLLSCVQSRWNVKITLKEFFTDPTLVHLATLVLRSKKHTTRQITPVAPDSLHPLSFAQNRLWFIEQLGNLDENYLVPLLLKMHGSPNIALLQRCLDHLIDRHSSLRSVFAVENGVGYSKLLPTGDWPPMKKYDFSTRAQPQAAVEQLYRHEIAQKFDISQGPLLRASLVKTGDAEHYLLLIVHHIVTDGWSMEILARELGMLYSAWHEQKANPLPVLALQYPDYAQWQQQWRHGNEWDEQAQFWHHQLQGAPDRLTLPTDRERPVQQSFLGASVPIMLEPQLCDGLRRLSQKHHTTLYMTLMSAWSIVLSRLAGQQDLIIGTPVANRQVSECEAMVGFFVNTLAIRIDLTDAPTVAELLSQVRNVTLSAQEHQQLPFDHVVELIQPHRSMDKTPLFQVMFAWENFDAVAPALAGLDVEIIDPQVTHVKFDLELNVGPRDDGLTGTLNYATALFDASTIERHLQYFIAVLHAMVNDDQQQVDRINMLSVQERYRLTEQWNQTVEPYPQDLCIHQLFEQQANLHPEISALTCGEFNLSYGALNNQANHLAEKLIALGVKVEDKVAICSQRSPETIVAILATLKAGAAYLSFPPDIAADRLGFMLADAQPAVVLAAPALRTLFREYRIPFCPLPEASKQYADRPNPSVAIAAHNLAYVIYTSGSTGNPKGVMVEHGNVVQLVSRWCERWGIGLGDNCLQFCNLTFDASACELFSSLTSGANLVLRDDQWLAGTHQFWQLCEKYGISIMLLPYQFWRRLCEDSSQPLPSSLRTIFFGGETAAPEMLQRWLNHHPDTPLLVNCYGPTETTVVATVNVPGLVTSHIESIGYPLANYRLYLLDPHGEPVPQGTIGELYIGGPGVARGYINLPEMTAECFMPDPFTLQSNARMYRSGDLASHLADGRIQFHGRNDHQVKIRGFRIELGEIETQLNTHPLINESAVLALDDSQGSKRLVAYVVADSSQPQPDIVELRNHLTARLPEYMVPTAYVLLPKMPISANGKLDRKALPAPQNAAFVHRDYQAPLAGIESQLAEIWKGLLNLERVGRHDHFFELGGHSLLAVRVISQLQQKLNINVSLSMIFDNPLLRELAQVISNECQIREATGFGSIKPAPRDKPLPLSFSQQRLWFLSQLSDSDANYNVLMALALSGEVNIPVLQLSLNALYERHETLRSLFVANDRGEPQVVVQNAQAGIPLFECDLRHHQNSDDQTLAIYQQEEQWIFDLSAEPLVRAHWLHLRDSNGILLLTLHHIITDGWSMEILVRELGVLYSALLHQKTDPLPALPVQYQDYAVWQQQLPGSSFWQVQEQFWLQLLAGAPERLTLPTDRPRPAQQSFIGSYLPIELSTKLSKQLRHFSARQGTSLFMTLLTAWSIVLSRLAGQDDLVIGTPVANRDQAECEGIVGFFVNTLALRINLSDAPSVVELLAQVRKTTLDAQEHQTLPFEQVVEITHPPRSLDKTPLFQVMFSLENVDDIVSNMAELDVKLLEPPVSRIKFDLELSLGERNQIIKGSLNYTTALFDKETIQRHKEYLVAVLEAMVSDDSQLIRHIDLVGEAERYLLLEQWNQTAKPYPTDCCIHHLFEQHATQDPDAIALIDKNGALSYGELNLRANALAYELINQGVKAEDIVAICVDRSPEMVVGILAILKAGGAYLSLPHDITAERLRFMLDDAKPVVILAEQATLALFQSCGIPHYLLARNDTGTSTLVNPQPQLKPHNLAYVIYTSGSTGNPKGVLVEHRNLVQQMVTWCQQWGLGKQDKVLQFCNTTFDVSVSEIFSALSSGATLVLRDDQWLVGSADFWQLCQQYGISYLDIPYQFWRKLCEDSDGPLPSALRLVCISGEAAAPEILERWLKRYPTKPELVNCYGPTEATITATTHSPKLGIEHIDAIGRPTANIRIYLLDPEGHIVPRGVIGEVYIGGPGVTRGYLNLPEMTAERFLPDPFNPVIGARMYRTGDLASYLADGRLQFHGRNDHQVKIRGFRIELGEIETQLNSHLQIKEAVVLALESKGNKRLIAYMVAAPGAGPLEPMAVRQYLQNRLPDYMIPAAYVLLDKMPITPNGKLDRKALPKPRESAFLLQPYEAPVSELECLIADTWKTLLEVDKVGRYDHFFELGGHSLLAVSAVNLINKAIKDRIGVSDIFIAPTVKQLAQRLKSQTRCTDVVNLHQYAQLPEDIQPLPGSNKQGKAILLTGATGFVGRFLLRELLDATPSKIYCLVRGQDRADSLQRLKNILDKWSLWREGDEHRIIVLHGDIKEPQLGMDEQTYASVSKDVGVIFHSAVSMNHLESFEMAYQANIAGLIELLRLATQGSNKILNFASTLNVFSPMTQTEHRVVDEASSIKNERHITSQGYVASKWVGEQILNLAVVRGIACNIFRLGLITADSELARYDERQAFYLLFKSSIQIGMAFDDVYGDIELTPVDFTAKALVHLGCIFNPEENIFHLSAMGGISRRDFITQLNSHLSQPMAVVSHRKWLQEACCRYQKGEVLPITPLIQDMMMSSDEELDNFYQSQQKAILSYDSSKTLARLTQAEIILPMTSSHWYQLLVDSLKG